MLFAARLVQGAADGMTWVVGFAMIADLYGPDERGRAMGLAMAGSTLGIIIGPVLGGWLYEVGGIRLPFLVVAAMAIVDLIVFAIVAPRTRGSGPAVPMRRVLTHRPVAITALVVIAGGGTIAMLEPVIPLVMQSRLGLGPAAIGIAVWHRGGRVDHDAPHLRTPQRPMGRQAAHDDGIDRFGIRSAAAELRHRLSFGRALPWYRCGSFSA